MSADFLWFCAGILGTAACLARAADRENQTPNTDDHNTEDEL